MKAMKQEEVESCDRLEEKVNFEKKNNIWKTKLKVFNKWQT